MEHTVRTPFNKPYEARNTMSAFTQKEIAALTSGTVSSELKKSPASFIAATVTDRSEWDMMYICMACAVEHACIV